MCYEKSMEVKLSAPLGNYDRPRSTLNDQQTDIGVHRKVTLPMREKN